MKVLIVSHNPLSTYQSMGKTMLSLFSEFDIEELYQLYIYPSVPDVDRCKAYYRITDKAVLKGIFTRSVYSCEVQPDLNHHTKFECDEDKKIYNNPKNSSAFRLLLRDIMWKISPWWNSRLKSWLIETDPDIIFLAPGNCSFIYNIALKIARERRIPIVSYICDEYYFVTPPKNIFGWLHTILVKNKIAQTMHKSSGIVTICCELEEAYEKEFNKPTITLMTGANGIISKGVFVCDIVNNLVYMGNISCNREKSLCDIGLTLDEINQENGTHYQLTIYTGLTNEIEEFFEGIKSVELHDFVSGDEFTKVFKSTEMFLHTEDFQFESIDRVKHSVSTKIADILASGIPLFAYGPNEIASMEHLKRNDAAICVSEKKQLKKMIQRAFNDKAFRETKAQNGLHTAGIYHNSKENSICMYRFFEEKIK